MGRPTLNPGEAKRRSLSLRTTATLGNRVKAAAQLAGRSVAQEIEHRLERSFRDDDVAEAIWSRLVEKIA